MASITRPASPPAPAVVPQPVLVPQQDAAGGLGLMVLLAELFILYGRILDFRLHSLHLPTLCMVALIAMCFLSGRLFQALATAPGKLLVAFTVCACLGVPVAASKGGALWAITHHWRLALVVFVALACLATNLKSLRLSVQTLGVSIIILACIANVFGDMTTGRLTLPQGKFGNPNDLAEIMLMGFPFLIYILDTGNLFLKLTSMGGMLIVLAAMARTGSRGASLALLIVVGFVFFRSTVQTRILMVAAAVVALATAVVLLPHSLRDRYFTYFHASGETASDSGEGDARLASSAISSAEGRRQLLILSIKVALTHPILGVGMEQFPQYINITTRMEGERAEWLETHNSYTMIASEIGLPGFAFYLGAMIVCLRWCTQIERFSRAGVHPRSKEIRLLAFCLKTSLISYFVSSFFANVAYQYYVTTLAGLTVALRAAVQPQLDAWLRGPAPPRASLQPSTMASRPRTFSARAPRPRAAGER